MKSFVQPFSRVAIILAASPILLSQVLLAQGRAAADPSVPTSSLPSAPLAEKPKNRVETSVSLGLTAQLTAARINDTSTVLTTQSLPLSAGAFTSFRQSFKPWLGYSVNLGYTRSTYRYTISSPAGLIGPTSRTSFPSDVYEVSVSYIAQKHLTNHITAFGEAGGGTLAFAAINRRGLGTPRRSNDFLPEGVAGFGLDYRLPLGLGLRAQYRGLFFQYPYPDGDLKIRLRTITSEPTFSLTYTFGKQSPR